MFIDANKLFTSNMPSNHNLFYRGDKTVSFAEFSHDVAHYANIFARVDSNSVILFIPDDIYLFYVCFMALMQAGKDVILPAMLNEQNSVSLLGTTDKIVTNQNIKLDAFSVIDLHQDFGDDWDFCDMDNRVLYFFTSGSTGTPKRIRKTFHNLAAEVAQHNKMQREKFDTTPVMVASIAPYHMYGLLWRFLIPLAGGIAVDTGMIFTPEELQAAQSKFKHIMFATTPSFLDSITKYKNQYTFQKNCIGIFSSGSLLDTKTSETTFETFGVSPFEIFGSTETGGVAFRQQKNGVKWTVFDDVKITLDENGCIIADSEFCCSRPYPMSDVVEMQNERQFLLRGRADRIVKIAEERISLPEYEEKLTGHEFVEKSYVTTINHNNRLVIGCVLTLNDVGKQFIIKNGRHAFVKSIKDWLAPFFPNVAMPRRMRIVNKIPTNTQGKILKNEILATLNSGVAEPIAQNIIKTDKKLSGDLTFLGDSAYFKGHFEGYPILPGVIQLHFVIKFMQLFFNVSPKKYEVIKLKFSSLILPDNCVHFELEKLNDNEFYFSYDNGDVTYSSGKIMVKE